MGERTGERVGETHERRDRLGDTRIGPRWPDDRRRQVIGPIETHLFLFQISPPHSAGATASRPAATSTTTALLARSFSSLFRDLVAQFACTG